jgi:hypothetical protein
MLEPRSINAGVPGTLLVAEDDLEVRSVLAEARLRASGRLGHGHE